jgi:hypothetical protein
MHILRIIGRSVPLHVILLSGAMLISLSSATINPLDDHFFYQQFIETLAEGRVDFSNPGFHGASFLAVFIYLATGSSYANIYFQLLCASLLVPMGYIAVSSLLKDKVSGLFFAYIMAMSPFFFFLSFRGFTFSSFTLFMFISIYLYTKKSVFLWLPLGISFLIKPFSIALTPLFLFWPSPDNKKIQWRSPWVQIGIALLFPVIYIIAEYMQIGRILIGANPDMDQTTVFASGRILLNVVHGIQMLFSVHNYYFPDPSMTGPGNLVHSSPILMFLGVFTLLYPRMFWKNSRYVWGLRLSVCMAYALASLLDHMDHFYMQTTVLLLVISSIAALRKFPLLIPLVLATLHFQWLYAYLNFKGVFSVTYTIFALPILVDILFVMWCALEWPRVKEFLSGKALPEPHNDSVLLV